MAIIKIKKPLNFHAILEKMKLDADKNKIKWTGNTQHGHVTNQVFEARYETDEQYIIIEIIKKPPFVSLAKIEREIQRFFS